jgi:arylsulfatase A-like enzyme
VTFRLRLFTAATAVALIVAAVAVPSGQRQPTNVILFVPDGLRSKMVTPDLTPAMSALMREGVYFENSHSQFPTVTMPNASALATGHYIGDTGVFGNVFLVRRPVTTSNGTLMPQIENDRILGELDEHFGGNFLGEVTLLEAARRAGYSTAAIGKLGPTLLQDHTGRAGDVTFILDDSTGTANGVPVTPELLEALKTAGLPLRPPPRGDNARGGDSKTPGTLVANVAQQDWLATVVTRVVLPMFKARNKPFAMVYWSRDPDATQHNHGDSLNQFEPGINGPTSLAAIRNADDNLRRLREGLKALGLDATTNIMIAADHGFSTVSRESETSPTIKRAYKDVVPGKLPPGFLSIDLAEGLQMPLWEHGATMKRMDPGMSPAGSNGIIGEDPFDPDVFIAANGGSELVYLPKRANARQLARRIVELLAPQDYVSGIWVDDALGSVPGTLPLSDLRLVQGSAATPKPSMLINFRTFTTGCAVPTNCSVMVSSYIQQGQGNHGSFSRAETFNFMAAVGPDFKSGYADRMPVGNADVSPTLARLIGLRMPSRGSLNGRVLEEALVNGREKGFKAKVVRSKPGPAGLRTVLKYQQVGSIRYFDVAGYAGRTVGLDEPAPR